MQKQTEATHQHEDKQRVMQSSEWTISAPGDALHNDFPSSFFIAPKVVFYCPHFSCLHSIVTGQVQISSFMQKTPRQAFHYVVWAQPSSIHQQCPCSYAGPPKLCAPPFDITLLWLSGPLCWLLSEADWRPFVCVSPCPEWPGGTCLAASGETGMCIWMGQCVPGTCWQRDAVPLWVLVHQRNHLVQLHMCCVPWSFTLNGSLVTAVVNILPFGIVGESWTNVVSDALFEVWILSKCSISLLPFLLHTNYIEEFDLSDQIWTKWGLAGSFLCLKSSFHASLLTANDEKQKLFIKDEFWIGLLFS